MKNFPGILSLFLSFIICSGCSKDDVNHPIVGEWHLTAWSIGIPLDLNNDAVFSDNILEETACEVNETLNFDRNGIVTSNESFNPQITIRLMDGKVETYSAEEVCAEGTIGFSTDYEHNGDNAILFNQARGVLANKKLTLVYKNAIKIYKDALNVVIETRDLTLTYQKG